jgi:hypothetical protein
MATPSVNIELESRVTALEVKVAQLQRQLEAATPDDKPWWEHVVGAFADDPDFEEAMRLGREYRESLRPRASKRAKAAKTRKR